MTVDEAVAGIAFSNELPTKWRDINPKEKEQIKKRWALDYGEKITQDKKENPQKWNGISKKEEQERIKRAVKKQEELINQINTIKSKLTEGKRKILIK